MDFGGLILISAMILFAVSITLIVSRGGGYLYKRFRTSTEISGKMVGVSLSGRTISGEITLTTTKNITLDTLRYTVSSFSDDYWLEGFFTYHDRPLWEEIQVSRTFTKNIPQTLSFKLDILHPLTLENFLLYANEFEDGINGKKEDVKEEVFAPQIQLAVSNNKKLICTYVLDTFPSEIVDYVNNLD